MWTLQKWTIKCFVKNAIELVYVIISIQNVDWKRVYKENVHIKLSHDIKTNNKVQGKGL